MNEKIKMIKGPGKQLGNINVQLNAEGFYLPWDEKQIEFYFRNMKKEINTVFWNDVEGNKFRLIFIPQSIKEDIWDSTLNVIAVEYFTIEAIIQQIRKQLRKENE